MKKGSGTKRMLAVALTIAMLLQNSAGVLATDGVAPVSDAIQGQSTEQQNTDAVLKQTDEGNSQQETKAPETPGSETPAQTEAPQTDAPKPEATETDVPKTDATETDVPQADTPQTSAPETQETPGLTLPDGEKDNETNISEAETEIQMSSEEFTESESESESEAESETVTIKRMKTNATMRVAKNDTLTFRAVLSNGNGESSDTNISGDGWVDIEMMSVTPDTVIESDVNAKVMDNSSYYFIDWVFVNNKNMKYTHITDETKLLKSKILDSYKENGTDTTFLARFAKKATITFTPQCVDGETDKAGTVISSSVEIGNSWKKNITGENTITSGKSKSGTNYRFRGWQYDGKMFSTGKDLSYKDLFQAYLDAKGVKLDLNDDNDQKKAYRYYPIVENIEIFALFEPGCYIGFNLINSCDIFNSVDPSILRDEGLSSGKGQKYGYIGGKTYNQGDDYIVPDFVPHCTDNNKHVFLGWFDKQGTTDGDPVILHTGDTGYYNRSDYGTQTLDAVWIFVESKDDKCIYDGKPHKLSREKKLSVEDRYLSDVEGTLDEITEPKYTSLTSDNIVSKTVDGQEMGEGYVEAGGYCVTHTLSLKVSGEEKTAQVTSTLNIAKRPLTLQLDSSVPYTGTEQKLIITEDNIVSKMDDANYGLAEGQSMEGSVIICGTDAGSYPYNEGAEYITNTIKIRDEEGHDVTKNYDITIIGTLTITPMDGKGTVRLDDWTYGDSKETEKVSYTEGDYGEPRFYYKKAGDSDEESSYSATKPTDAGEYVVKAVWTATTNYKELIASDSFTIKERNIHIYQEEKIRRPESPYTMTIMADPKNFIDDTTLAEGDTLTVNATIRDKEKNGTYNDVTWGTTKWSALHKNVDGTSRDVTSNYNVIITGKLVICPRVNYVFSKKDETGHTVTNAGNLDYYEPGKETVLQPPVYIVSNGSETREYKFVAWYTDSNCTEENKRERIGIVGDSGDITLYAKWKAVGRVRYWLKESDAKWDLGSESSKIVSDQDKNSMRYIDVISDYTDGKSNYLSGTINFTVPTAEPSRIGYNFNGWRHETTDPKDSFNYKYADDKNLQRGKQYTFPYSGDWNVKNGEITPDQLTLKAQWTPYTYKVTFDANGETTAGSGSVSATQTFTYGTDGKLNQSDSGDTLLANFTKTGYTFAGWSRENDATVAEYQNGAAVSKWTIGDSDIVWPKTEAGQVADKAELTLYAVWTPNTYKATFHKNYGTGDEKQTVDYTYDAEGTLNPKEAFTRPGYKFSGWATNQEATAVQYQDGAAVSNWKIGDGTDIVWPNSDGIVGDGANLDLYAVWTADFTELGLEGFTQKYDGKTYSVKISGNLPGDTVTYYRDAANNSANKLNVDQVTAKNVGESIEQVYAVVTRGKESTTLGPVAAKITPREVTLTSGTASKKYDGEPLKAETVTVSGDGFVEGEGADYTAFVSRTLVGSSDNTFSYTLQVGTDINNYQISTVTGTLTVADEPVDAEDTTPVDPTLVVSKTHGTGSALYEAGQTVTFTIRVKNIYDAVKTITLTELAGTTFVAKNGVALSGNGTVATFENVAAGAEVEITAIHVITNADVAKGTFENNVTVAFSGEDPKFTGHDEVKVDQNCTYTVEFRNQLGETIHDSIGPFTVPYGTVITGATTTAIGGTTVAYKDIKITGYKYLSTGGNLTVTSDTESNVFIVYYQADMEGVHAHGFRKTYDGQEYAVSVSGNLPGDVITYTYQKPGTSETVTSKSPVRARNVEDSVAEVTVTIRRGAVTTTEKIPAVILPRKVVLESASLEKEFDGDPLMNGSTPLVRDGYKNVGQNEGWVKGEGYIEEDLFFYGGITEPGNCPNVFGYTLKDGTQGSNYDIAITVGTLTVKDRSTPYELTVEANSGTFTYDGTEKTVSGLIEDRFVVNGYPYHVTGLEASVTKTDAGTYTVEITGTPRVEMVAERGLDVTKQFTVHFIPGKMTIAPRPVTLTSGSSSKEYDGQPLTNDNVTAVGFVGDDGAEYQVSGSQTLVGSSQNKYTYELKIGTLASNYTITQQYGTLTVNDRTKKLSIDVRARSATYTYDGTEKKENRLARQTFEINGRQFTVEGLIVSGQGTNAGTYDVTVSGTAVVRDEDGNDVTTQFDVSTTGGNLTINKRPLTLKSASIERKWDGSTPLTNGDTPLDVEDGWVAGEGATYTFTGEQTGVGESNNTFDISPKSGTKLDNYKLDQQFGKLKITNRPEGEKYPITVKARSASYLYDGTEKKEDGFETLSFRVNGEQYTVFGLMASGRGTDAASYTVQVTGDAVVKDTAGNNVTAQFDITSLPGTLTIRKRTVVLKSADKTKVYDGTELTNGDTPLELDGISDAGLADEGDGWAVGEGAVYTFSGSQTVVGKSPNTFNYAPRDGTKADNYEIKCQFGTLTVTDRTEKFVIDVTAESGEYTYDGMEKTVSGLTGLTKVPEAVDDEWTFKINGQIYTLSGLKAEGKGKDAGTYTVSITGTEVVKDNEEHDVTGEFTVVRHEGKLTIHPRDIVLISDSATQMYDPYMLLSRPDVTILPSENNFVNGEAEVTATGEILYVGSVTNTIKVNGKAGSGYNEENYHITKREGTLRVTDGSATNPLDSFMVVTKEHDEDTTYEADDVVIFTISAMNIYNETKTMTLTELEGVTFADTFEADKNPGDITRSLSDDRRTATFGNVLPGTTVTIEAAYTIADADVANGGFTNAVTVEFSGPGETKTFTGKDTVDRIDRDCCAYTVRFVEKNSAGRAANEAASDLHAPIQKTGVKYGTRVDGNTVTEDGTSYSEIEIPGYVFAETNGPLTVTTEEEDNVLYLYYEADFTGLDATGVDKTYDGEKSSVSVSGPIEGDKVTYTYTVVKDDGTEQKVTTDDPITVKEVKDSVKGDVTVTVERGGFTWTKKVPATITPRKVTLQSADLSKKYDGQPLVNGNTPLVLDGVADSGETIPEDEGWAQGDSVSYSFTGRQIEVGTSENSFEVVAGEGTDLSNYAIEKREGKLTVTAADPVQAESQKQAETETKKPSEPETEKTKTGAKLTVTKSIISGDDGHLLGLDEAKFYVALFKDAKMTELAGEIRELDFDLNTAIASVTYRNLKPGTYYVAEVNAKGKVVSSGKYGDGLYAANYEGDVQKVTIGKDDRSVRFAFENRFLKLPKAQYYRDLGLPKDSKNGNNKNGNSKSRPEDEQQTEPESGAQANGTGAVGAGTEAAKTGDGTPIEWMLLLLAASGMLLILTEERRRRSRS